MSAPTQPDPWAILDERLSQARGVSRMLAQADQPGQAAAWAIDTLLEQAYGAYADLLRQRAD